MYGRPLGPGMNALVSTVLPELASTILLHPGEDHGTTAAAGGGGGIPDVAIGVFAVAGLTVGLYLLADAVEFRAGDDPTPDGDEDPA